MRKFYQLSKYEQYLETRSSELIKFSCTCPDFTFRCLKKDENGKTRAIKTCKHIEEAKKIYNEELENKKI